MCSTVFNRRRMHTKEGKKSDLIERAQRRGEGDRVPAAGVRLYVRKGDRSRLSRHNPKERKEKTVPSIRGTREKKGKQTTTYIRSSYTRQRKKNCVIETPFSQRKRKGKGESIGGCLLAAQKDEKRKQ